MYDTHANLFLQLHSLDAADGFLLFKSLLPSHPAVLHGHIPSGSFAGSTPGF